VTDVHQQHDVHGNGGRHRARTPRHRPGRSDTTRDPETRNHRYQPL